MHKIILFRKSVLNGLALIIFFFFPGFACAQNSGSSQNLTADQKLSVDIFSELIEINTTVNMGSTKAAEAMAARLKSAGFPETDIKILSDLLRST